MEYRALGNSEVTVSALSLGSWLTIDHIDRAEAIAIMGAAIDRGVTFFDDARYDDRTGKAPLKTGYSEVVFGEVFRAGGWRRDDLVIANKLWLEFFPDESPAEELEGSLVRLEMDHIDLLYTVPPPKDLPMAELVGMMSELVESGKIRAWGGLNWSSDLLRSALDSCKDSGAVAPVAVQVPYNMLYRAVVERKAMREVCRQGQISVVASYGLGGGVLTNKYLTGSAGASSRLSPGEVAPLERKGVLKRVAALAEIAEGLDMSPSQLALAYCLAGPQVASVVFGTTRMAQLEENLGTMDALPKISGEPLAEIRSQLSAWVRQNR